MFPNVQIPFLQSIARGIHFFKNIIYGSYGTKSLSDVSSLMRVEPLVIISNDLRNIPELTDLQYALLRTFSGYYLMSASVFWKLGDVEVIRVLDRLNPNRDSTGFILGESFAKESFHKVDPLLEHKYRLPTGRSLAQESINSRVGDKEPTRENISSVKDLASLSVGEQIQVPIYYNKEVNGEPESQMVNVDVNVRLLANILPANTIVSLLASKKEDMSFTERVNAVLTGRIRFIQDLILCQDIHDERKRAGISDKTNTLQEILRRASNSKMYGLLARNPSLASASNIFVISSSTARQLEIKLGGKLSDHRIREKAFESTYAMIIAVLDTEWEEATIYIRNTTKGATLSYQQLKRQSGKGGADINDIMKAISLGQPPAF